MDNASFCVQLYESIRCMIEEQVALQKIHGCTSGVGRWRRLSRRNAAMVSSEM